MTCASLLATKIVGSSFFFSVFRFQTQAPRDTEIANDLVSEITHAANTVVFFPRTFRPTAAPAARADEPL